MRDRRWWIVAPLGHREYAARDVPDEVEFLGEMIPVIKGPMPPLDEWICDYCSDPIPLEQEHDGEMFPQMVPMENSNALCPACVKRALRSSKPTIEVQEWSDQACACPPCKTAFPMLAELTGIRR